MTNPRFASLATPRNLALALDFSRRRQLRVQSPVTLLYRISDALAFADNTPAANGTDQQITAAIRWEQGYDDDDSLRWIHRLTRSTAQVEVLTEWRGAGRG